VLRERVPGTLQTWSVQNNTIRGLDNLGAVFAPVPAIARITYDALGNLAVTLVNRVPTVNVTARITLDGSWPTADSLAWALGQPLWINRTVALNARFYAAGLLPSPTMTYIAYAPIMPAN
jgi:hypothetical protein